MKPRSVEPGQVWVLEELGVPEHPREPTFCGAYLVTRLTVLESARRRHFLGEPWTTQAFGLALDVPIVNRDELGPDGTACLDYLENLLHEGERLHADSAFRWRFVA